MTDVCYFTADILELIYWMVTDDYYYLPEVTNGRQVSTQETLLVNLIPRAFP